MVPMLPLMTTVQSEATNHKRTDWRGERSDGYLIGGAREVPVETVVRGRVARLTIGGPWRRSVTLRRAPGAEVVKFRAATIEDCWTATAYRVSI